MQVVFLDTTIAADTQHGVIAMRILGSGDGGGMRDPAHRSLVVVCNAQPQAVKVPGPVDLQPCMVHPAMAELPHVQGASYDTDGNMLQVPAQTIVCFAEGYQDG